MSELKKLEPLYVTYCNKAATTAVEHVKTTWEQLAVKFTSTPTITEKRDAVRWPLFAGVKMMREEDGAKMTEYGNGQFYSRCNDNVIQRDALILDFDNDPKLNLPYFSYDDALESFAGIACALYTSYNHRNPQKGNVDKFRVVLPLLASVTPEEFVERKSVLQELFPNADPASFTQSQPFYIPLAHPDRVNLHRSDELNGERFDLLSLVPKVRAPSAAYAQWVQTGDVLSDLPSVRLKSGTTYRADELYNVLQEGYDRRVSCYRIGAPDHKPGCFIYRKDDGLFYKDPNEAKARFIKVMRTKRAVQPDPNDVEVETSLTLKKKPKIVAVPNPITVPDTAPRRPLETSYVEGGVTYTTTHEIIELDQRFLPDELHERIPERGITLIRSPKGTGKTTLLKKVVAQATEKRESVLLLGHRQFLLRDIANRTDLAYYLDLEEGTAAYQMVLCLNSIPSRIKPETHYDVLIIDEVEQVFQALLSSMLKSDINYIYTALLDLMGKAKRVICLDADLSPELTIELLGEMRHLKDSDSTLAVNNTYKIGSGRTTLMYQARFHLLTDAVAAIDAGAKSFICCNSINFATSVAALLRDMEKSVLLVTKDTNQLPDVQAFINNPTVESKRYDVVVTSPTLSTGVSIDGEHFTKVYGFYGIYPGTYQDIDQAISRVRNPNAEVSVWVQPNQPHPPTKENPYPGLPKSESEIYQDLLRKEKRAQKLHFNEGFEFTKGQLTWARLEARLRYLIKIWSRLKDIQFMDAKRRAGFTITPILADEVKSKEGIALYSCYKHVETNRAQEVFDSPLIDEDEAMALGRKRQRTRDEQMTLEHYNLWQHLKDDWTIHSVSAAINQDLLRSLKRIQILYDASDEDRRAMDVKDQERNKTTFTVNKHRAMQGDLIHHLERAAGLNFNDLHVGAGHGRDIPIPREALEKIAKAFEEKQKDFNYYFSARIKDPTSDRNLLKVWESTLGEYLSLHLVKKKKGPRDARVPHYFIDAERKHIVYSVLEDQRAMTDRVNKILKRK